MIIFKCDFCNEPYDTRQSIHGFIYQVKQDDGSTENVTQEKAELPCRKCEKRAETAKDAELERIRAEHQTAQVLQNG